MKPNAFVLAAVLLAAVAAQAEPVVPPQADWDAARQTIPVGGGLTLAYVELGTGDGTPLILLHGYTDNSRSWSLPAPFLGDRPIYALDLRGHGASDAPDCCYGIDTLAHDVVAFMDAKGIERADLVGHSLGSMTAALVAATDPERVGKLVLVSTALRLPEGSGDWLRENVPALQHPIDPDSQFMLDWYWNPTPVDEDFLTRERSESAATPQQVWNGVLVGLSIADWSALAPQIEAPTLVLWGDQDSLFGAPEQEALRTALPAARFETFEGLGHNMFWEQPERAGRLIADFLDE
jgi:pimeloyl-ACP methyl ester carboxylesterase